MRNVPFSQHEEKMKKGGHEGLKVQSCIFLVSKSHGYVLSVTFCGAELSF